MNIVAIIPARMNSSRFPGKPMKSIHGTPMIGHCYYRTKMCSGIDEVYVATCDHEIYNYIKSIGGNAVMTSELHEHASDRVSEAMLIIEKNFSKRIDIVVMIQGDEPMVTPDMLNQSIEPLVKDCSVKVVNLMARIETIQEFLDPNEVKVVVDMNSDAIYFSREPIPSQKKWTSKVPMLKQVCIIPFQRDYLIKFSSMHETELERIESIDMLRVIESGEKVRMVLTSDYSLSVDTQYDLDRVVKAMRNDALMKGYI